MTVQRNQAEREMERGAVCTPPAVASLTRKAVPGPESAARAWGGGDT